jgi:hypothetical protein
MAAMTNWFFDTFPTDSAVITTAPTSRDVRDLLWATIRQQRKRAGLGGMVGNTAPEMRTSDDHFAKGFTAAVGESFQGRHYKHMMFGFDEAIGVAPVFWNTTNTMFQPGGLHIWLAILNPTDTTSQAYQEEQAVGLDGRPKWHTVSLSSLGHPNLAAELAGLEPPIPAAVTLAQFEDWVADWCEPVGGEPDKEQGDFEWRPGSGKYYRPSGLFESRALGRWPRQGISSVWSDSAWAMATKGIDWKPTHAELPVVGCDLAFEGDDWTCLHTRWGPVSWSHERYNGWLEEQTAGRLKQICAEMAAAYNKTLPSGRVPINPQQITVFYDASGRGGALANFAGGFNFVPVHAQGNARCADFFNRRSELWFASARLARKGEVDFTRLDGQVQARLRQELLAVRAQVVSSGQLRVEDKRITKQRLKRSPDEADAVNLAYLRSSDWAPPISIEVPKTPLTPEGRREANDGPGERKSKRFLGRGR